jgi:EXLDI family protein
VAVPNKTIYVSEGDVPLYERAQQLAGGNLSQAIAKALKRWVDAAEGVAEGYGDVHVRVGLGNGRKVRFVAALVGEWTTSALDATKGRQERFRVYQGRTGKYVLHVERGPGYSATDSAGKPAGWRGWMGVGDVTYTEFPKENTLDVFTSIDELRDKVPAELFSMVERAARFPTVEELDI